MTASNFPACFLETEGWEGWHKTSADPYDPGGLTYCGLTDRAYQAWRTKHGLKMQHVVSATDDEIKQIFREEYWGQARCDDCYDGLDLLQFDIAINMGPGVANKMLQRALGVTADGVFGLETLARLQRVTVPLAKKTLIQRIAAQRMSFWRSLKTWWRFGKGWSARGNDIEDKALAMVK